MSAKSISCKYTRFHLVVSFRVYANSQQPLQLHAFFAKHFVSRVHVISPTFSNTRVSTRLSHSACMQTPVSLLIYTRFLAKPSFRVYMLSHLYFVIHAHLQNCHVSRVQVILSAFSNTRDSVSFLHSACITLFRFSIFKMKKRQYSNRQKI